MVVRLVEYNAIYIYMYIGLGIQRHDGPEDIEC